jgi:hypothetical protein
MASIYEQMFDKMFDETTKKRHEEHILSLKIKLEEGRQKIAKKEAENKLNNSGNVKTEENLNKENVDKLGGNLKENKVDSEKLNLSNASQTTSIIENNGKRDDDSEKQVIKPNKKSNWVKAVFGSMFFVGCATGFYFLMRFRNKFR